MHYAWEPGFRQKTRRSLTPPSRSETASNDFWRQIYSLFDGTKIEKPDDIDDFVESLREIGNEEQEKFDNMSEGLQQSPTGQLLEERATEVSDKCDELESAKTEWENDESFEFNLADYEPSCG